MKKITLMLTAAAALLAGVRPAAASTNSGRFNPRAVTSRSIKVDPARKMIIAAKGKALCEVVVPRNNRATRYAGEELAAFIGQITGSKVPVVNKRSGRVPAFILGAPGAKLIKYDLKKLDRDGFIIKTLTDSVIIAGNDDPKADLSRSSAFCERGTLNGVYDFLERFAGVRFYFPGEIGTIVPVKKEWVLPGIDITERPDSQHRLIYCTGVPGLGNGKLNFYDSRIWKHIPRLTKLRIRESTLNLPNCHGLATLSLVQRFAKTKPEFFALRENGKRHDGSVVTRPSDAGGQLCLANEELKEVIFQDAKACLTGQPASSRGLKSWGTRHNKYFFNIMPNDSHFPCKCAVCDKAYSAGPQASSDFVWKFKTDIARKLQQQKVPGYCTMMAYANYRSIPNVEIPSNTVVMLALSGPWNELNPNQSKYCRLIKEWSDKLKAKSYLWVYTTKIGTMIADIPGFTPYAVGSFFKKVSPWSFGAFLEAETDYWLFNALNYYVFGKVLWDLSSDVDAMMTEHLNLMYGAAAPMMKEFYTTLERHWLKDIMGNIRETLVGPQTVLPSQHEVWTKIYGPKELERINKLFDNAEKAAAKDKLSLKRVRFMRKELWEKILDGAKRFKKQNEDSRLWTVYALPVKEKIVIDGKLDEAVWKKAAPVWMLPRTKEKAEVHTRIRMLADKEFFYVGIESDEPCTDRMLCAKRKFDEADMWQDNLVELFFSGKKTDETIYQIMLTSSGNVCDMRNTPGHSSTKWNSALTFKPGVIPGKMWIAEVKIPRNSMPEIKGSTFAVNFTRGRKLDPAVKVTEHYYTWSKFPKQKPEYCGTAVIGEKPLSSSVIAMGDFDAPFNGRTRFMKSGKDYWWTHKKMIVDRTIFRTAGVSMCLHPDGGNTLRQFIPKARLKSNTRYNLSFFVKLKDVSGGKAAPGAGVTVELRYNNGGKNPVYYPLKQPLRGTMDWTRFEFEFTTPGNVGAKRSPYIGFNLNSKCKGRVWLDHIQLTEVPTSARPTGK